MAPPVISAPLALPDDTRMPPDCTALVPVKVSESPTVPKRSELVVRVAGATLPDTSVLMPAENVLVAPGGSATMEPPVAVAQDVPFTVAKAGPLPNRPFTLPVEVVTLSTPGVVR